MADVIYQNKNCTVVNKPAGADTEKLAAEMGLLPVHRLDMPVSGVLVLANTKDDAACLTRAIQEGRFHKTYLAVVCGVLPTEEGTMHDLLFHDSRTNKTFIVNRERKGVKAADLSYKVLGSVPESEDHPALSLVEINLITGRSHQIRVQFGSRKVPLAGDGKYGSTVKCQIALMSQKVQIDGIGGEDPLVFSIPAPKSFPWNYFSCENTTTGV